MIISIDHQLNLVIFSFLAGFIIGILFDFYRIIRGYNVENKVVTVVEDLLFWILVSIIVFVFLLYTNYAYIGFYVYLFITFGMLFYIKFISKSIIAFLINILSIIGRFIRVIFNIIIMPFEILFYKVKEKNIKRDKNEKMTWRKFEITLEYRYKIKIKKVKGKISIMGRKFKKKKIICALLTVYVFYIFGKQQIIISNINTQIAEKNVEYKKVKIRNQKMLEEIDMTKTNDYIEKLAREKLGLIKSGENTVVDSKK